MKFKMTKNSKVVEGITVYQIQATQDIPEWNVTKGDLGGWIASSRCLDEEGACWIASSTVIIGNSFVTHDAYVEGTIVKGQSTIGGKAKISGNRILIEDTDIHNGMILGEDILVKRTSISSKMKFLIQGDHIDVTNTHIYGGDVAFQNQVHINHVVIYPYYTGTFIVKGQTCVDDVQLKGKSQKIIYAENDVIEHQVIQGEVESTKRSLVHQ